MPAAALFTCIPTGVLHRATLCLQQRGAFANCRALHSSHPICCPFLHPWRLQWHGWFEVAGEPFEVAQLCSLWVELRETQQWKRGIVLDSVRLVRQQAQQAQQEGQPQAAEAQAAAAGQEGGDESVWARVRRAARALGLMGP